jgi:hypothetical protein
MPTTTTDREAVARLKLAVHSYRKAQAKQAAMPSAKHAAKLAACEAQLAVLLEISRGGMAAAA